jgi:hypothetical protein
MAQHIATDAAAARGRAAALQTDVGEAVDDGNAVLRQRVWGGFNCKLIL